MTKSFVPAAPSPGRRSFFLAGVALSFVSVPVRPGRAADNGQYKVVGGIGIYYGVIPAEIVRGHARSHGERSMHGGPPPSHDQYHLVVALFDAATSTRIEDAKVRARVSPLGAGGSSYRLEPMKVAGTLSYGTFLPIAAGERYTIHLEIERPGLPHAVTADFLYEQR